MTQGNPFGRAGGRWMTSAKLRALFNAGLTYDEIAEINERSEGWKPSRSTVKLKLEGLGMTRRMSHRNLIPWKIKPEHNSSELRHMLQAESRSRQGAELSDTDRKLVARLHELLFGRGKLMVVSYHPDIGFGLVMREDCDDDIIRQPRSPRYADDGLENHSRSREERKGQASAGRAEPGDDASPRRQACGR